jgi:hypothetical protein
VAVRYGETLGATGADSQCVRHFNADSMLPAANGKYDVSRQLEAAPSTLKQTPLLNAA